MENPTSATRGSSGRMLGIRLAWLGAGAAMGIACFLLIDLQFHQREATPALRGEAAARRQGCFQCHGPEGRGGVGDPGSRSGTIPGWDGPTAAVLVASAGEFREWVLQGRPARLGADRGEARRAPVVPMPAYRGRISERDLADILVYFRAVSNFGAEMPEAVYEGWKVAERKGCFGCHGPGGVGGGPNPGSFKGHIPAWDGAEFRELVRDDAELREWILNGYPERLWRNPAARHFLEGQVIGMPAYRTHLSLEEQANLTAYFQWLGKKSGPQKKADDSHRIMGLIRGPLP